MRPRWRSRGAGPDGCIHRGPRRACAMGWFLGPQRERRTAAAELVGSRGMTARGQGKKVGGAVAGQGRAGARPAQKRGRLGASPHDRQRSTLAVGTSSARSVPPVRHPPAVTATMPLDPTTPTAPDTAWTMSSTMPVQDRVDWVREPLQVRTRSDPAGVSSRSASKEAISASGALNRPRLSSGGTTASTASSFSEGSMRR